MAVFLAVDLAVYLRYAIADWPSPWRHILGELNTITWLSTVQLSLIGFLALAIGLLPGRRTKGKVISRLRQLAWGGMGMTFLFLSADEFLQIHEHLAVRLPGLPGGEGLLLAVGLLGGLAATVLLLPVLLEAPTSLTCFVVACVVAILSQAVDIPDLSSWGIGWEKGLEMAEEALELAAESAFIASLLNLLRVQVGRQAGPTVIPDGVVGAGPQPHASSILTSVRPTPGKSRRSQPPSRRPIKALKSAVNRSSRQ